MMKLRVLIILKKVEKIHLDQIHPTEAEILI